MFVPKCFENGAPVPHVLTWRGGFRRSECTESRRPQHTVHYDAASSKLITKTVKDAKERPFSDTGDFTFGGLEDNFFAAVALPVSFHRSKSAPIATT